MTRLSLVLAAVTLCLACAYENNNVHLIALKRKLKFSPKKVNSEKPSRGHSYPLFRKFGLTSENENNFFNTGTRKYKSTMESKKTLSLYKYKKRLYNDTDYQAHTSNKLQIHKFVSGFPSNINDDLHEEGKSKAKRMKSTEKRSNKRRVGNKTIDFETISFCTYRDQFFIGGLSHNVAHTLSGICSPLF